MKPSGADDGFFQPPPTLLNQFYDDYSYRRCFELFLPRSVIEQTQDEVAFLGQDAISDDVFAWVSDAYRNLPYLKGSGRSSFGRYTGELVTGEGWRQLQKMGISKGIVATGYDSPYGAFSRPLQFLRMHLWSPSSAVVTCPSAMQDGAACLLRRHLTTPSLSSKLEPDQRRVYEDAYRRLTSRDPNIAWTSGQWMTERTGGSDISLTETTAALTAHPEVSAGSQQGDMPLGPWSISGFKWFSSATDSNMTILIARTVPGGGLSAFIAPMRRHDPHARTMAGHPNPQGKKLNGVRISRLKKKFGTQSLPTAELVLQDMRAWLVGEEGKGIQEISSVLKITRIYSAVSAVSGVGRALAIAKAFARVREVGAGNRGRMRLTDSPLHMRTLAMMAGEYRGLMLLSFYAAYVLGVSEHPTASELTPALEAVTPEPRLALPLIRVLSQIAKAYVCKPSVALVFSCMESLGGVGYMDNEEQEYLNVSRIFRDISVLPIWEGTTDVLSTDTIRALKHPKTGSHCIAALDDIIGKAAAFQGKGRRAGPSGWDAKGEWKQLRDKIVRTAQADLMGEARDITWAVGDVLVALLLQVDAARDGDVAGQEVFARFVKQKFGEVEKGKRRDTATELGMDTLIVYGREEVGAAAAAKL